MPAAFSDYLLLPTGGARVGAFVELVDNVSGTGYVSTSATDGNGKFTMNPAPPAGMYTVYVAATNLAPLNAGWVAAGNSLYQVSYTRGDNLAVGSVSSEDSGPYTPTATGGTVSAAATGAVAGEFGGSTASGPPATGTWKIGAFVTDQTGNVWVCTAAGTPGTWAGFPRGELASAHLASNFSTTSTSFVDLTGLSLAVTVASRPLNVCVELQIQSGVDGGQFELALVEDNTRVSGIVDAVAATGNWTPACFTSRRNPAAGAHTYKVQIRTDVATTLVVFGGTDYIADFMVNEV